MKTIKRVIVLFVCFVLLSNCLSMNVAAEESYDVLYTAEDLIDLGFIDIGQGSLGYFGYDDPFDSGISLFSRSSKNFSDFDVIKSIPWSTFPNYIMEIMEMSLDDFAAVEGSEFKTPFVCIQVEETGNVNIWAGINVGLGTLNDSTLSFSIYGLRLKELSNAFIFPYSCLYRYAFNYKTGKVSLNWTEQSPTVFGNYTVNINDTSYPNLYRFAPWNLGNQTSRVDFYLYGGNGVYYSNRYDSGTLTSLSVRRSTSDANAFVNFTLSASGFRNGKFLPSIATNFSDNYFQFFEPLSRDQIVQQLQQEENETSKGIWETLKGIPSQIGSFFDSLKNYLLYFQETKPEHVNPFAGILDGIQSFFDDQIADTDNFKSSLDTTFLNVSGYIETGSNVINRLLAGVPILNTVIVFLLAFAVIRKVVGR